MRRSLFGKFSARSALPVLLVPLMLCGFGCADQPETPNGVPTFKSSLLAPAPAAETITVEVDGTVTVVADPSGYLDGRVDAGDPVVGLFVYDENAPDEHPQPDVGRYRFRDSRFVLAVHTNRLMFASNPSAVDITIKLTNDKKTNVVKDQFEVKSTGNHSVLPGVGVASIDIVLVDETASALASDALAGQCPDAVDWLAARTLTVTGVDGWTVEAAIDLVAPSDASRRRGAKEKFHRD